MVRSWIAILLVLAASLVLAACGASQTETPATQVNPDLVNALPPEVALSVQNQISQTMAVPLESIQIENVEKMDWQDSCLGLPEGDEVCAEVITPGWLLTFNINNETFRYRVDETGTVIRQEP